MDTQSHFPYGFIDRVIISEVDIKTRVKPKVQKYILMPSTGESPVTVGVARVTTRWNTGLPGIRAGQPLSR